MPSHAYFFDGDNVPDWNADESPTPTAADAARRERIAATILVAFPDMERYDRSYEGYDWIDLYVPGLEIAVYHHYLHLRLRWRSRLEMQELNLVENLHRLARVVNEAAGFDYFEHGCQGLGVRANIDLVPEAIAPTARRLHSFFGVAGSVGAKS